MQPGIPMPLPPCLSAFLLPPNRGLIISKLPEGFNAAIYAPPLNRKRTRLLRVFVRVDGDMLKACYDGVEHTITTNPLHDSITFPGYGTFLRDDQIFG